MANIDGHNNLQWYLEMDYDTEKKEVILHIFKILKCKKIWLFGTLYKIQFQEYLTIYFNYNTVTFQVHPLSISKKQTTVISKKQLLQLVDFFRKPLRLHSYIRSPLFLTQVKLKEFLLYISNEITNYKPHQHLKETPLLETTRMICGLAKIYGNKYPRMDYTEYLGKLTVTFKAVLWCGENSYYRLYRDEKQIYHNSTLPIFMVP